MNTDLIILIISILIFFILIIAFYIGELRTDVSKLKEYIKQTENPNIYS